MTFRPLLTAVIALGLCPLEAWSFDLLPISREFSPSGSGAVQSYEVVNSGKDPIAISVSVLTRSLDAAGQETNESAEDDFLVYPPQFIVGAGKRQTLRVTWLGNPVVPRELAYRLLVEQLPIDRFLPRAAEGSKLNARVIVLTRYKGSLYITPDRARSDLVVDSATPDTDSMGHPLLKLTVRNRGTARTLLRESKFQVKSPRSEVTVTLATADLELPSTVVLPGGERRLLFLWPEALPRGEIVVSVVP